MSCSSLVEFGFRQVQGQWDQEEDPNFRDIIALEVPEGVAAGSSKFKTIALSCQANFPTPWERFSNWVGNQLEELVLFDGRPEEFPPIIFIDCVTLRSSTNL